MGDAAAGRERQGETAGIVSRLVANVVDGAVILTIGFLLLLGAAVIVFFVTAQPFHIPQIPRWIELPVAIGLVAAYFTYGWSGAERTVGQYVMGLRVVGTDGRILNVRDAGVRTLAYMVFPWGLGWVVVSRRDASLQDLVLRTRVIYDWSHRPPPGSAHPPDAMTSERSLTGSRPLTVSHNGQVSEPITTPADHTGE